MDKTRTRITEQCGAQWTIESTGQTGCRAFWVFLVHGRSLAMPGIVGFYCASIAAACDSLNN